MSSEKLLEVMGNIDEAFILETEEKRPRKWLLAAAVLICLIGILPNTHENVATAMAELPLLGQVFESITIRTFESDSDNQDIEIKVPEIISPDQEDHLVIDLVNASIESYIQMIMDSIPEDVQIAVDSDYQIITNTDTWFTLMVQVTEVQASGYSYNQYFHIDKDQHTLKSLGDLFVDDTYQGVIMDYIKEKMVDQMASDESLTYFPEYLTQLPENQGFYFNEKHHLVIVFNEYDVAPGYMGIVEFIIEPSIIENLWQD